MAVERAKQEGIRAKMIIIDDDAAFPITKGITGGRGLAGTLFVHKVAGALSIAPAGYDLDYIHSYLSENIVPFTRTLGVALTTCTVPGTPASDRLSASDSYEVGLGIHGEPGREKCILPQKDIAKSIAATLVSGCLDIAELPVPEPETDSLDMMVSLDVEINVSDHIIPVSEPEMTVTEVNESDVATDSAIDTDPTIAISTSLVDEHATIESEAISEDVAFDEVQSTPQKGPVTSDSDTQPTVPVPASILKSESDSNIKYPESTPLKRPSVTPRTRLRNTPSSSLITPSKGSFRFNFAEPVIERRPQRLPINAGSTDELVLIINNLGSLPIIEMYVLAKEVLLEMKRHKLNPVRVYMGHFMTSLDMSGCSLSVLNTTYASEMPDEIPSVLSLLDVETSAPAWMNSQVIDMLNTDIVTSTVPYNEADFHNASSEVILTQSKVAFSCAVALTLTKQICLKLIEVEPILTKYDQICGDGDCGLVMKAGASKILADIYGLDVNAQEFNLLAALKTISTALLPDEPTQVTLSSQVCKACGHNPAFLCDKIATCISESMGGTSGILLEICFRTMSTYILELDPADVGEKLWIDALDRGVTAIQNYGGEYIS